MDDLLGAVIAFVLTNFTGTFAAVGFVIAAVIIIVTRRRGHELWLTLLNWFLLIGIGITYIFNGIMHTVFGDFSASLIGWENNGFQAEVGYASIGMGLVAVLAFPHRAALSLKFAAIIGPACFLWGAASAHIIDIIQNGNMSSHNAGLVLYTDIFIPVIGFALWGIVWATRTPAPAPAASAAVA